MITNFSATLSIAIPTLANIAPLPIFPIASSLSTTDLILPADKPKLEYPPSDDDDWEVQSVDDTPAIPVPPPQHHIYPEVLAYLHTLHVMPAPLIDILRPNCKPTTPTDPVPFMPFSPPQFLQADPQDPAPPFKQIVNALVQCDVDMQVAWITREEEEEAWTPSPMGPQLNVHPGPRWHVNFEEATIHYVFQIPLDNGCYEIAPFIMIDWDTTSPELLGTCRQGCPIYAKHLHTYANEFPHPALNCRQEFFFADNQTHSEGVDWAMGQEGDDTICAEVICHCAACTKVIHCACQVTEMQE